MQTLSYGYQKPTTGDAGATLFTALEDNITRVNAHSHNGVDSAPLTPQSIPGITATALAAGWGASGATGHYRQQITMPAGFVFGTVQISFRTSTGQYIHPTVERVSNTQFFVYTIDNTIDFLIVYGG